MKPNNRASVSPTAVAAGLALLISAQAVADTKPNIILCMVAWKEDVMKELETVK